ncbi:MAG: hypothetical protein WDN31_05810 [Hyphomicrobium sp.]
MRVFLSGRKSPPNFSDVLEDASRSAGIDIDYDLRHERVRARRAHGFERLGEIAHELRISTLSALLESYLEHQRERKVQRARRTADPQAVAGELCITEQMTLADLTRLRRRFALANHPDRAGADEREVATRRMMVANMLIDGAIKRRGPR